MKKIKLLGIVSDIPSVQKNVSCAGTLVYKHLNERGYVSALIDPDLPVWKKNLLLSLNSHPQKPIWLLKYQIDVRKRYWQSKRLSCKAETIPQDINAVLQIGSEFTTRTIPNIKDLPTFSYHDDNIARFYQNRVKILPSNQKEDFQFRYLQTYAFESYVYEHLKGIFCKTEQLRQIFIEAFHLNPDKVHTVGFGHNIDTKFIQDYKKDYSQQHILFIAQNSFKAKGGYKVIDAYKHVRKQYPMAKLTIVGAKLDIDIPGLMWAGSLDKTIPNEFQTLLNLYKKANLLVFPSFSEAADNNVLLEAMAFKLPFIALDQGSIREIITNSQNGLLLQTNRSSELVNKMISLFENEALMQTFGENSFKAIQSIYNWDVVCNKVVKIISKICT